MRGPPMRMTLGLLVIAMSVLATSSTLRGDENVFPTLTAVKQDRPRLLIRPHATRLAISLAELHALPRDRDVKNILERLRGSDDASAQAMLWLMTGEAAVAEKAIARLRAYRMPAKVDTFHVYLRLREFALAYDWLHDNPMFDRTAREAVRANITPLAREGLRLGD